MNIYECVNISAAIYPDREAIVFEDRRTDYADAPATGRRPCRLPGGTTKKVGFVMTQEANEQKPAGMKIGKRYRCATCSTEVLVTRPGQGTLVCCSEPMQPK